MTPSLEETIQFALDAHRGQVDRCGQPFIAHPLRVMLSLPLHDLDAQIAALLHDVVEDTPYTLDDLRQRGYAEAIIEAVDCLTRRETETYEEFIQRIKPNALARRVKLADLRDNMNLLRLPTIDAGDAERLGRYRAAWHALTGE